MKILLETYLSVLFYWGLKILNILLPQLSLDLHRPAFYLWWVSLDGVEDVDEDEEDGDEETHPAGDALGVDKEADPADHDEEAGREVEGDDVEADFPGQHQLEASNTETKSSQQPITSQ